MFKLHVLDVSGHFEHRLHVTEGGAKDQFVALPGHVAKDALSVSAFWHFLDKAGDDLVTEFFFDSLASVIVRKGPAAVTYGADVGKRHFQRLHFGSGRLGFRRFFFFTAAQQSQRSGRSHCRQSHSFEDRTLGQVCHENSLKNEQGCTRENDKRNIMNPDEKVCLMTRAY